MRHSRGRGTRKDRLQVLVAVVILFGELDPNIDQRQKPPVGTLDWSDRQFKGFLLCFRCGGAAVGR